MAESPIPTGTEESPSELKRTDGAEGPAFFDSLYMCRDLFAKIVDLIGRSPVFPERSLIMQIHYLSPTPSPTEE